MGFRPRCDFLPGGQRLKRCPRGVCWLASSWRPRSCSFAARGRSRRGRCSGQRCYGDGARGTRPAAAAVPAGRWPRNQAQHARGLTAGRLLRARFMQECQATVVPHRIAWRTEANVRQRDTLSPHQQSSPTKTANQGTLHSSARRSFGTRVSGPYGGACRSDSPRISRPPSPVSRR